MSFDSLGLAEPLLRAVRDTGYTQPTPIQLQCIPAVLQGQDIMAAAQTGTGKTAGFTLPLLQRLMGGQAARAHSVRALVLTPTRELAAQVQASVETYGKHLRLRSAVVFGGVNINPQIKALQRGVDVLVATPGRLLDLYQQRAVDFKHLEILVLDEADRMLDMGFIHDIKRILALLPAKRQNLLFSATFSGDIRNLAKGLLDHPTEIDVAPRNSTTELVEQVVHPVDKGNKAKLLAHLIRAGDWTQALVFSRTKHGANKLAEFLLKNGISAAAIHGNKSQGARTRALNDFKQGQVTILVATDIAARGLDIPQMPQVVNFDLPNVPEDYVHRIGRTGRAGMTGHAISLVCAEEAPLLADIERLIKRKLEREEVPGFIPSQSVPASKSAQAPARGGQRHSSGNREPGNRSVDARSGSNRGSGGRNSSGADPANGASRGNEGQARRRRRNGGKQGGRTADAFAGSPMSSQRDSVSKHRAAQAHGNRKVPEQDQGRRQEGRARHEASPRHPAVRQTAPAGNRGHDGEGTRAGDEPLRKSKLAALKNWVRRSA